ncbi:MAG: hypothetical protein IPP97_01690 [Candidatus Obscuribacter sp.]|nr:hypothetical protein [Candidatus Obscuribacter sp.]MBP6351199.1 hypothetical protein [Candidatus Obscuribacter sp.]MBP6592246.1 hypothetical protein [Candidatus Obscuribacter sp.]MBP7578543.1 hypothetical protein [Candidatus Obscuribacter sp.]
MTEQHRTASAANKQRFQGLQISRPLATTFTWTVVALLTVNSAFAQPRTAKPSTTPGKAAVVPAAAEAQAKGLWLKSFSDIQQIAVPTGWYVAPLWSGPGCISQRLKPAKEMRSIVDYFVREYKVVGGVPTAAEIKARQEILKSADHALTQKEKDSIPELLSAYNSKSKEPIKLDKCQTLNLHGRRAIYIEGSAPPGDDAFDDGEKCCGYFVDTSMNGTRMVELLYRADPDMYDKFLSIATQSMNSVRWK